jgi:hypothetical protein
MYFQTVPRVSTLVGTMLVLLTASHKCAASAGVPDIDRVLLVVGQNVTSVNGYVESVGPVPAGIMSYTSTANAEGLDTGIDYGTGLICGEYFITNSAYATTVIQLGLYIDNDLTNIISGVRDAHIAAIGNWIRNAGRPVYLRIGYEFDAPWNALLPDQYIAAYRHIVEAMRANGVTNAVYVWHAACSPTYGGFPISAWYPGDDYVDWAGISVFRQFDATLGTVADIDALCAFAKSRNRPIMIAESAPYGGVSEARWTNWFQPCLELIGRHHIQMWCYINTDWEAQPMFAGQGWGDTRIQQNTCVQSNWLAALSQPMFLKKSAELYPRLHADATNCWREAEGAMLNGVSVFADPSASGGCAVAGLDAPGRAITFTNAGSALQFVLRYAATNTGTIGLYINSQPRRSLPLAGPADTADTSAYRDLLAHATIPSGATVKFQFDAGDVSVRLDSVLFRSYTDSDGDGLPDDWERWRFGTLAYSGNDDPDGDHSPNYSEFAADTDPLNSASAVRIDSLSADSGVAKIMFSAPTNRDCLIQYSSDLRSWIFAPTAVRSDGASVNVTLSNLPPNKLFFRLTIP